MKLIKKKKKNRSKAFTKAEPKKFSNSSLNTPLSIMIIKRKTCIYYKISNMYISKISIPFFLSLNYLFTEN